MDADNHEQGRYEVVACTSSSEIVLWARGATRAMLGFSSKGEAGGRGVIHALHRAEARDLAAADVAERDKTTFAFYADEVLRANLWPNHWNDAHEAAQQVAKVREALAISLRLEDPFRAAVEFEQRMGIACDIRLVHLFEATLDLAAIRREGQLLARSPMAKALKRSLPEQPFGDRTGPSP